MATLGPVLALCLVAGSAWGQVHRCEVGGRLTYSDQPCEADAKASTFVPRVSPRVDAALDLQVQVKHYEVQGNDRESLLLSLKMRGPQGFHGLAQWKLRYAFTSQKRAALCQIDSVRVSVEGEILMPRWRDEARAAPALRQRWADYIVALKQHEDGHIDHGRELALSVRQGLLALGPRPCDQLVVQAQREFDRLQGNAKDRDRDYDARTQHGATQGARF
jgi:predicted secreted Zn-dependent protease